MALTFKAASHNLEGTPVICRFRNSRQRQQRQLFKFKGDHVDDGNNRWIAIDTDVVKESRYVYLRRA